MALVILAVLLQGAPCTSEGASRLAAASARAAAFDLAGAAEAYAAAAASGCEGGVPARYLRGLLAARAAYAQGGSPESLEPVREAIAALEARGAAAAGAQIARFVLLAAAAAAQSERDEMALMIDQAMRLEAVQLAAGQPGAPAVTAHEIAGDLWFQVHRYEDARRAYMIAAERVGRTARVTLGLARTAARLADMPGACLEYRALVNGRTAAPGEPPELREARAFIEQPSCADPQ